MDELIFNHEHEHETQLPVPFPLQVIEETMMYILRAKASFSSASSTDDLRRSALSAV